MKRNKHLFKKGIAALLAAFILVSGSAAIISQQGTTNQVAGDEPPTIEIYNITPIDSPNCVA